MPCFPRAPQSVAQGARTPSINAWPIFPSVTAGPRSRLALSRYTPGNCKRPMCSPSRPAHEKDAYIAGTDRRRRTPQAQKNLPPFQMGRPGRLGHARITRFAAIGRAPPSAPRRKPRCIEKYAQEHPDSPRSPEALYQRRLSAGARLSDIYSANGDEQKSRRGKGESRNHCRVPLLPNIPNQTYAARACQSGIASCRNQFPSTALIASKIRLPEGLLNDYILSVLLGSLKD